MISEQKKRGISSKEQGRVGHGRPGNSLPDIVVCIQLSPWEGAGILKTGTR